MQVIDTAGLGVRIPRGYNPQVTTVGDNIKRVREGLGLSQVELADRMDVRQPAVWKLENQQGLPESGTLLKVAKTLSCSVEDLLRGVDDDYDTQRNDLLRHSAAGSSGHHGGDPDVPASVSRELADLRQRVKDQQALLDHLSGLSTQMLGLITKERSNRGTSRTRSRTRTGSRTR